MNHMRLEFSLHENHERRDVAHAPVNFANFVVDEMNHPGMFASVLSEWNATALGRLFLPHKMLRKFLRQPREQAQTVSIMAGIGKQGILDLLHFEKQMVVLGIHLTDAS